LEQSNRKEREERNRFPGRAEMMAFTGEGQGLQKARYCFSDLLCAFVAPDAGLRVNVQYAA